ncbi:MAG: hypothetical protein EOP49_07865 [Sphingobacteriales bacterium]|nr:MAG: hypothetical protein EOP49_07865 [Sphingobacteriales bacterium]
MNPPIRYHWGANHLLIRLGNRTETRIRILFCLEFIVTMGMATIFLIRSFHASSDLLHWMVSCGAMLLYGLAAYRFFSRMFFSEELLITDQSISIIRKTPFSYVREDHHWEQVGTLHYPDRETKTDHPLKGNCFDYFGFDTQEKLVQRLHHDGNLMFIGTDKEVRFARGIYSWHAEELIRMIRLYAGSKLRLGEEWKQLITV